MICGMCIFSEVQGGTCGLEYPSKPETCSHFRDKASESDSFKRDARGTTPSQVIFTELSRGE